MRKACDAKLCALVAKLIIFHRLWKMFITNRNRNSNWATAPDRSGSSSSSRRLPAVPADWPQPNYNNNSKCIEDAKLNVSPRSFAKNNTKRREQEEGQQGRRAAGRGPPRRRESRIEKCVSLNVIYSQQFYAFKARLSTATSASAAASASASPCGNADDAILKLTVARLGEGCASETAALAAPLRPQ